MKSSVTSAAGSVLAGLTLGDKASGSVGTVATSGEAGAATSHGAEGSDATQAQNKRLSLPTSSAHEAQPASQKRSSMPGQSRTVVGGSSTQSSVGALLSGYAPAGSSGGQRPSVASTDGASQSGSEKRRSKKPGESKTVVTGSQMNSAVSGLLGPTLSRQPKARASD